MVTFGICVFYVRNLKVELSNLHYEKEKFVLNTFLSIFIVNRNNKFILPTRKYLTHINLLLQEVNLGTSIKTKYYVKEQYIMTTIAQ